MPFDPNYPPLNAPLQSAPMRNQFNALNDKIEAVPAGPQGPQGTPGEVTQAALDAAIAGTSNNSNPVSNLVWEPNDPPTADDLRTLRDKINELINALRR
jgi:hypothetical protein